MSNGTRPFLGAAVVIDTNSVGRGFFRHAIVESLAGKLHKRGHTLVVPECVVWEWSEHAQSAASKAAAAMEEALRNGVGDIGMSISLSELPGLDETYARIVARLEGVDGVTIFETTGQHAIAAVQAQVQQTGPASKSNNVKTGAADSLVAAAAIECVEVYSHVLLMTRDQLLASHCREASAGKITVVANQNDLLRNLPTRPVEPSVVVPRYEAVWPDPVVEPPDDVVEQAEWFLRSEFDAIQERRERQPVLRSGFNLTASFLAQLGVAGRDRMQIDVETEAIDDVRLDVIDVPDGSDWSAPREIVAVVEVDCFLSVTEWRVSGPDFVPEADSLNSAATIRVLVTVGLDEQWKPDWFSIDDEAEIDRLTEEGQLS